MADFVEMFLEKCKSQPDAPAIIEDDKVTSYAELEQLTRRIAAKIFSLGREPKVLIALPQGAYAYATIFATLMVGGVYCALNENLPVERKINILEVFSPDCIVFEKQLPFSTDSLNFPPAFLDVTSLPGSKYEGKVHVGKLAYLIFTSGSTGIPKGVMIRRSALSHLVDWTIRATELTYRDRWGQFSNLGFDMSAIDIFVSLCGGASLIPFRSPLSRAFPARYIHKFGVTVWNSVPSVIDLMDQAGQISQELLSSLRLMIFGGEPLRPKQLENLFAAKPEVKIVNIYGPTEITIFCTWFPLSKEMYKGVSGTNVAIIGKNGNIVSGWDIQLAGGDSPQEGEIIVRGEHLAAGYWNDESRTNISFGEFDTQNGLPKLYRTRDWAEWRDDHLFFKYRIDRQAKIYGNRIELEEVDFFLQKFGISNSFSLVKDNKLHTFIETDQQLDESSLTEFLYDKLPSYSIPSRFHLLKVLPRNHNDKIDATALEKILEGEV